MQDLLEQIKGIVIICESNLDQTEICSVLQMHLQLQGTTN